MQPMLVTLEDSLLHLRKRDAGNGVIDIAVVLKKGEKGYDGGAEVIFLQEFIYSFVLLFVLEELFRIEGLGSQGEGPRLAE